MKQIMIIAVLLLLWISAHAGPQRGELLTGKVVAIADGDTLTLLTADKQQAKIRLAEIDTPESKQPFGTRSRQMLSDLAFGKEAEIFIDDIDRYGRLVGRVYVGKTDVNATMVEQGGAWVYRQYSRDPLLLNLEAQARAANRGLWALPESERVPPWEWRRAKLEQSSPPRQQASSQAETGRASSPAETTTSAGSCGGKRTCSDMSSCAEARHYMTACGMRKLDRDGDGVPCEKLCN